MTSIFIQSNFLMFNKLLFVHNLYFFSWETLHKPTPRSNVCACAKKKSKMAEDLSTWDCDFLLISHDYDLKCQHEISFNQAGKIKLNEGESQFDIF